MDAGDSGNDHRRVGMLNMHFLDAFPIKEQEVLQSKIWQGFLCKGHHIQRGQDHLVVRFRLDIQRRRKGPAIAQCEFLSRGRGVESEGEVRWS